MGFDSFAVGYGWIYVLFSCCFGHVTDVQASFDWLLCICCLCLYEFGCCLCFISGVIDLGVILLCISSCLICCDLVDDLFYGIGWYLFAWVWLNVWLGFVIVLLCLLFVGFSCIAVNLFGFKLVCCCLLLVIFCGLFIVFVMCYVWFINSVVIFVCLRL